MGGQNTIMNIHISGLDLGNKGDCESQKKILNILFPDTDLNKKTSDYIVKFVRSQNGMLLFIQIKTPIISV